LSETRIEEFLAAYAGIERTLRTRADASKDRSFSAVLREVRSSNRLVAHYYDELRAFHELRNVLVHERLGSQRLAEPVPDVLERIKEIAERLENPTRLEARFLLDVVFCKPRDEVGDVAAAMREGDFSSVPVITDTGIDALLTAETIARWIGAAVEDGIVDLSETIEAVLQHTEDTRHLQFISRTATAIEALAIFDQAFENGYTIDAVLVTHSGVRTQKPLGIVTPFDVPQLLDLT
jgi:predicted transcriptional regulator